MPILSKIAKKRAKGDTPQSVTKHSILTNLKQSQTCQKPFTHQDKSLNNPCSRTTIWQKLKTIKVVNNSRKWPKQRLISKTYQREFKDLKMSIGDNSLISTSMACSQTWSTPCRTQIGGKSSRQDSSNSISKMRYLKLKSPWLSHRIWAKC